MSRLAVAATVLVGIAVVLPGERALSATTAPAITIDAQPKVVRAGNSVALTGSILVQQKGERVLVEQRACDGRWAYLKVVETDEGGVWGDYTMPSLRTSYRAVWRGVQSSTVTVAVPPFVVLRFGPSRRTLAVRIPSPAASLSGHTVAFQRLVGFRWITFRTVALHEEQTAYGRTFVAQFRHSLRPGTRVRAALLLAQARPCYIGAFSNAITL